MGYKKVVILSWNYGFGKELFVVFLELFEVVGGEVVKEIFVLFLKIEF